MRDLLDVFDGDVGTAIEDRVRLAAEDEVLTRARPRAPIDVLSDVLRRFAGRHTGRAGEAERVADDVISDRHFPNQALQLEDLFATDDRLHLDGSTAGGPLHDLELFVLRRVLDPNVEHESVELRLGERVGPLLLNGVLRRKHEERLFELVAGAADGDLLLLHRFEKRGLRLRRGSVDLVRENHVREDRPAEEHEPTLPGFGVVLDHLGAGDVGRHQVRGELDSVEAQRERLGEGADHEGLRETRDSDEETVPAGEEGEEELIDDIILSDDHSPQLLAHLLRRLLNAGEAGLVSPVACCSFK